MSQYTPIIKAYRLRAGLLQSQAESLIDSDPTAAHVLGAIAVVDEMVADSLEREEGERERSLVG